MGKTFRVISLGAGVQSSTLALLYENNFLSPKPDMAIFADTQAEPKEVYQYLAFLKNKIKSFPIITATQGDLVADTLTGKLDIPFFIYKSKEKYQLEVEEWKREVNKIKEMIPGRKSYGNILPKRPIARGMLRRQCTYQYKIRVVEKAIRESLGYKKYKRVKEDVKMILGISKDESQRMKISRTKWITNIYPLIEELDWSRKDCLKFFDNCSMPRPPRSSCWMCPYKTNKEWIHLKENQSDSFQKAVDFDKKVRNIGDGKYKNYIHPSCKPLGEITFKEEKDQVSGMNEECDGICGT